MSRHLEGPCQAVRMPSTRKKNPEGGTWWAPHARAWWIGVLFMVGSACFALGATPGYASAVGSQADDITYFVGSLFFTSAAFLQFRQAGTSLDRWACGVQLVGTLFFNVSTGHALITNLSAAEVDKMVWRPDAFGSICFLVASELALIAVGHRWVSWRPRLLSWWIAMLNLAGSVAFGVAAVASYVIVDSGYVAERNPCEFGHVRRGSVFLRRRVALVAGPAARNLTGRAPYARGRVEKLRGSRSSPCRRSWRSRSRSPSPTRRSSCWRCPTSTARSTSRSSRCRGRSPRTTSRSSSARSRCLPLERRVRGHVLAGIGLAVFAGASLVVRVRDVVPRVDRGPHRARPRRRARARRRGPGPRRASAATTSTRFAIWAFAGTIGAALGPALGGFLTQLFSWRSIFLVQAPLAALALVAIFDRARARGRDPAAHARAAGARGLANIGFLLVVRRARRRAVPRGAACSSSCGDGRRSRARSSSARCPSARSRSAGSVPHAPVAARRGRRRCRARGRTRRARVPPRGHGGLGRARARRVRTRPRLARRRARSGRGARVDSPASGPRRSASRPGTRASCSRSRSSRRCCRRASEPAPLDATRATTARGPRRADLAAQQGVARARPPRRRRPTRRGARCPIRPRRSTSTARTRTTNMRDDTRRCRRRDPRHVHPRVPIVVPHRRVVRRRAPRSSRSLLPAARRVARATGTRCRSRPRSWCSSSSLVAAEFRAGARDFGTRHVRRPVPRARRSVPAGQRHRRHAATHLAVGDRRRGVQARNEPRGADPVARARERLRRQGALDQADARGRAPRRSRARPSTTPIIATRFPGFVATGCKFLAEHAPIDWILGRINIPFLEN